MKETTVFCAEPGCTEPRLKSFDRCAPHQIQAFLERAKAIMPEHIYNDVAEKIGQPPEPKDPS